jgi:hypothetical protein
MKWPCSRVKDGLSGCLEEVRREQSLLQYQTGVVYTANKPEKFEVGCWLLFKNRYLRIDIHVQWKVRV